MKLRLRPRSGRGAGPETLDQFDIEPPEGPAGVVVGEARRRLRQGRDGGGAGDEDEGQAEREATADPPADPPRAVGETVDPPAAHDPAELAEGTVEAVQDQGRHLAALITLTHRLARTPEEHKNVEELAEVLVAAGERQEELARVLLGLIREANPVHILTVQPSTAGATKGSLPRRMPRANLARGMAAAARAGAPGGATAQPAPPLPPVPPSPSGAQLLPTPRGPVGEQTQRALLGQPEAARDAAPAHLIPESFLGPGRPIDWSSQAATTIGMGTLVAFLSRLLPGDDDSETTLVRHFLESRSTRQLPARQLAAFFSRLADDQARDSVGTGQAELLRLIADAVAEWGDELVSNDQFLVRVSQLEKLLSPGGAEVTVRISEQGNVIDVSEVHGRIFQYKREDG